MGLPAYIKTTPIPFPEGSHSTIKVFVKSSVAKTGVKALVAARVHENSSFFNNVVIGVAILP